MMLDLESVRLFVLVTEFGNMTRAAEAAGTIQPVVSQRLKALENQLDRKLLERTPRFVRLTDAGAVFLPRARLLLEAHNAALSSEDGSTPLVALGISDHALGTSFDVALRRMRAALPTNARISVHLGQSQHIRNLYEAGTIDIAILRREGSGNDGEVLGEDPLAWCATDGFALPNRPVPLIVLPPPCGVRAVATKTLERAGLRWCESFVGGSCLALTTAVRAGLGIAPLGRSVRGDLPDLGPTLGLPPLPPSQIVLVARVHDSHLAAAAQALASSVRNSLHN